MSAPILWQPTLSGGGLVATPLLESDFDALFAAASDPEIWALHPVSDRYTREKFEIYFRTGIESRGALLVRDAASGAVVGSSRFVGHDRERRVIEIGYTFLVRALWGSGKNRALKEIMLAHAFEHVDLVEFFVGSKNLRSRGAMEKLGGELLRTVVEREPEGDLRESIVYGIRKRDWPLR